MTQSVRTFLLWLLLLALPLQGMAVAVQSSCSGHAALQQREQAETMVQQHALQGGAYGNMHGWAGVPALHAHDPAAGPGAIHSDVFHADAADSLSGMSSVHTAVPDAMHGQGHDHVQHDGHHADSSCSACAACCMGASAPPSLFVTSIPGLPDTQPVLARAHRISSHISPNPERPPRFL